MAAAGEVSRGRASASAPWTGRRPWPAARPPRSSARPPRGLPSGRPPRTCPAPGPCRPRRSAGSPGGCAR
ncbi:hypothetical protein [Ornithinimicrobium kibberense]|uniref:hypothetical protein n=1 Tax=Ornithinimicrobium kibberense TaxID=282060 RepID=UPI00360F3CDA